MHTSKTVCCRPIQRPTFATSDGGRTQETSCRTGRENLDRIARSESERSDPPIHTSGSKEDSEFVSATDASRAEEFIRENVHTRDMDSAGRGEDEFYKDREWTDDLWD